jgi:enoyl-CoA hydratase
MSGLGYVAPMTLSPAPEIIAPVEHDVGRITLNRPKAKHALTTTMCLAITDALRAWREDQRVDLILIDHAGERGFRAGGDMPAMAEAGRSPPDAAVIVGAQRGTFGLWEHGRQAPQA